MLKFNRILKLGCKGEDVESLQERLRVLGYFADTSYTFGVFDRVVAMGVALFQTQHLGPDGKFLNSTGVVGEKTLWGLNHPSGRAQKSGFIPLYPPDLPNKRLKVMQICVELHQAKVREIPPGSNWGDGVQQFGGKKGWAWCSLSATWVLRKAEVDVPHFASVWQLWKWAEKKGMFYPLTSSDPKAHNSGNLLIWQHKTARGAWTKTGNVAIEAMITTTNGGKLLECNTFAGNEGHRWKYGHRLVISPY